VTTILCDTDWNFPPAPYLDLFNALPRFRQDYSHVLLAPNAALPTLVSVEITATERAFDKLLVGGWFAAYPKDEHHAPQIHVPVFVLFNLMSIPLSQYPLAAIPTGVGGKPIYPTGVDEFTGTGNLIQQRWDFTWSALSLWPDDQAQPQQHVVGNPSKFALCAPLGRDKPLYLNIYAAPLIPDGSMYWCDFRIGYFAGKFKENVVV